jgi:hypothetical protein
MLVRRSELQFTLNEVKGSDIKAEKSGALASEDILRIHRKHL